MITYEQSDITKVTEGIIAHGVNCQGVMGGGVALGIRKTWPIVFKYYHDMCVAYKGQEEELLASCHIVSVDSKLRVANCFTQVDFGPPPKKYADAKAIATTLKYVYSVAEIFALDVHTVKIGSDLGGLDWETEVRPIFEQLNSEYESVKTVIHYI